MSSQLPKCMNPPLTDALVGDLMYCSQHSADSARNALIGNRTVSNGEMRLFEKSTPVDFQRKVFHPGGRAAMKGSLDQRLQNVPDFLPYLAHRLSQRPGMLCPKDWDVGIVVQRAELRTPPEQLRKPVGDKKLRHHAQGRRPAIWRT